MNPSVEAVWMPFNSDLEGVFRSPYLDINGDVTVAIGCLCDPLHRALTLPWKIEGRPATQEEIARDWQALKSRPNLAEWRADKQAVLTSIRLDDDDVTALVRRRLQANYDYLRTHLMPRIDSFPADAQLGILSVAWGIGAAFDRARPPRPQLVLACNAEDWVAAKVHARLRESRNPGVVLRNRRQELCFDNAATIREHGLNPQWLWYPNRARDTDLKTLALKAVELGIARDSVPPKNT